MPTRSGMPQSFGIIMVFALLAAGVFALVGFAIHKGADRNVVEAAHLSELAGVEGWESGLFCIEDGKEDHPSLSLTERPPETCAEAAPIPIEIIDEDAVRAEANAARGAELYVANGCQVCHGEVGEGLVGPTIARTGLTIQEVIAQYRQPRGVMLVQDPEDVPVEAVADIWAWLQTLPAVDPLVDPDGNALGHENYGQWAE